MNDPCHVALFKHTLSSTSAVNCSFESDTERNIPPKKVRFSSAVKAALLMWQQQEYKSFTFPFYMFNL